MVRDLGYGGDIPPMLASYANQDLPKQYAIVKKNKETPVRIKVPNVPDITEISNQQLEDYIKSLEDQPWYFSEQEIKDQIDARTPTNRTQRDNKIPPQRRTKNDRKPSSSTGVSDGGVDLDKWKTLSQNLSSSEQHAPKDGKKKRD
jgi:hypothetical protein